MTLATLRSRRDTAANWTSANPILSLGEVGWETDTDKGKIGDGTTAWNSLGYKFGVGGNYAPGYGVSNGLFAANADPDLVANSFTPTAGVGYVSRVIANNNSVATKFKMYVNTAGSGLGNTFVAVYNSSGTQLAVSSNSSTAFQSTAEKTITIASTTLTVGTAYYLFFVFGSGTAPVLRCQSGGLPNVNVNRHNTYLTGLTAAPSPLVTGSLASAASAPFMALA